MANENEPSQVRAVAASRFRIVHLLYAASFICSGLATFGIRGMLLAVILCAAWGWVFASESRPRAFADVSLLLLLIGGLVSLILPAVQAARGAAPRMQCANNLKQIALALHYYHDVYKTFPPAYIADEDGRPMHSWRVLILPFLEQQQLYDAYRLDEPWDGPNNRKLLTRMPRVYSCPNQKQHNSIAQTHTSYVAVIGESTAWPAQRAMGFKEIVDGASQTLLLCEVAEPQISWMEPTDIGYAGAIELLTSRDPHRHSGHISRSFFYESSYGRNAALADGSVRYLAQGIGAEEAQRLLAANDGEPLDFNEIHGIDIDTRRLRIDNCNRLGVFVLLALWPLPWVWINPHGTRHAIHWDARTADEP